MNATPADLEALGLLLVMLGCFVAALTGGYVGARVAREERDTAQRARVPQETGEGW